MADFKLNLKDFDDAIANNRDVQRAMQQIAVERFEVAKNHLVNEFESHPVSIEINDGPNASNTSGTLGGYGNLFSFIGFEAGESPVRRWSNFIKNRIRISNLSTPKITMKSQGFVAEFDIEGASEEDMVENAQTPWENGRSWLMSIERGISGLGYYISKKLGRSGGGIQSNSQVRPGGFRNTSYWSGMWGRFMKELGK